MSGSSGSYNRLDKPDYDYECKVICRYRESAQDAYAMSVFYRENGNLKKAKAAQKESAKNYAIAMHSFIRLGPRPAND